MAMPTIQDLIALLQQKQEELNMVEGLIFVLFDFIDVEVYFCLFVCSKDLN